jgi:hypothetical protein
MSVLDGLPPAALDGNDPGSPSRPTAVRNGAAEADADTDEALTECIETRTVPAPASDGTAPAAGGSAAAVTGADPTATDQTATDQTATDPDHGVRAEHAVTPIPRLPLPGETAASGPRHKSTARKGTPQDATAQKAGSLGSGDTEPANGTQGPDRSGPTDAAAGQVPAPAALVAIPAPRSVPLVEQLSEAQTETPGRPMAVGAAPRKADERPRLRRRVPQASLAPGLRVLPEHLESDIAPPPSATEALSRYQASRAAARSVVEDDPGHERAPR